MKTIYDFYNQAYKNSGKLEPVLVMKMNTREPLVVIDFEHFIDLIKPMNNTDPTDPLFSLQDYLKVNLENVSLGYNWIYTRGGYVVKNFESLLGDFRPTFY